MLNRHPMAAVNGAFTVCLLPVILSLLGLRNMLNVAALPSDGND